MRYNFNVVGWQKSACIYLYIFLYILVGKTLSQNLIGLCNTHSSELQADRLILGKYTTAIFISVPFQIMNIC